jgi:Nuclease-related domain
MAKVLGEPGRYVSQQAVKKHRRFVLSAFMGCCLLAFLMGLLVMYGFAVPKHTLLAAVLIPAVSLILIILIQRQLDKRMDVYETERINFLKGATGEQIVARKIDDLPDGFCVIHDLATPFGNLDHVVVGPTGVFVLETKNWKGVIEPDGRGGILHNGRRHLKDAVNPLIVRMMNVRKKIGTLCDNHDELPYFNALLVFTSARVEVKWGQTGKARCISDEQIWDCIVESKLNHKLSGAEIEQLTQAFSALASMDRNFTS